MTHGYYSQKDSLTVTYNFTCGSWRRFKLQDCIGLRKK